MTKIRQDWSQNERNSQNLHSSWKTLRTSWKNYVQPPFYWPLKISNHFTVLVQMIWLASRSLEFLQVNFSSIYRVVLDGTPNVKLSAWVAIDASEHGLRTPRESFFSKILNFWARAIYIRLSTAFGAFWADKRILERLGIQTSS